MNWKPASETMIVSDDIDHTYQISRTPKVVAGRFTYRAWHRPTNLLLGVVECYDERGDRAAAIAVCKETCERHARGEWTGTKS